WSSAISEHPLEFDVASVPAVPAGSGDHDGDPDDLREQGYIVGTAEDIREHLDRLDEVGVDRVMLQWLALDDMDRLKALADAIL
ncbi:MAG: hypothetical protein ABEI86_15140, partial [Halobacteriaceae archaeon]